MHESYSLSTRNEARELSSAIWGRALNLKYLFMHSTNDLAILRMRE